MKNNEYLIQQLRWVIGMSALLVAAQCNNQKDPYIDVYSSSQDGDRLTRKYDVRFIPDQESSLPVIAVNGGIKFQKVDGFGATFNEAGMICLNSIEAKAQEKVLKMLFDTDSGAGFNLMKSPIAACDFASAGSWYSFDDTPGDTAMIHFSIARDSGIMMAA